MKLIFLLNVFLLGTADAAFAKLRGFTSPLAKKDSLKKYKTSLLTAGEEIPTDSFDPMFSAAAKRPSEAEGFDLLFSCESEAMKGPPSPPRAETPAEIFSPRTTESKFDDDRVLLPKGGSSGIRLSQVGVHDVKDGYVSADTIQRVDSRDAKRDSVRI